MFIHKHLFRTHTIMPVGVSDLSSHESNSIINVICIPIWVQAMQFLFSVLSIRIKTIIAIYSCCLFWTSIAAQILNSGIDLYEDESELQQNLENLLKWYDDHPIDLNEATKSELLHFPLLSVEKVNQLLSSRQKNGPFINPDDLLNRLNWTLEEWHTIEPYIQIKTFSKNNKPSRIDVHMRIVNKPQIGKTINCFPLFGANNARRFSLRFETHRLSFSAMIESDLLETNLLDHTPWNLTLNINRRCQLQTGSYQLSLGYGLAMWGPFTRSLLKQMNQSFEPENKVRAFVSGMEAGYLKGIAFQYKDKINMVLFASYMPLDATLDSTNRIISIQSTGLHATSYQLENRHQSHEYLAGFRLGIEKQNFKIHMTCWQSQYSHTVFNEDLIRNFYGFSGKGYRLGSLDYWTMWHSVTYSGEVALCQSGKGTSLQMIRFKQIPWTWAALWLYITPGFNNSHGQAGTSGSDCQNSWHFNIGYHSRILKYQIQLLHTRYLWRTYFIPMAPCKQELYFTIRSKLGKSVWMWSARFKQQDEVCDGLTEKMIPVKGIQKSCKTQFKFQWQLKVNRQFMVKHHFCWIAANKSAIENDLYFKREKECGTSLGSTFLYALATHWRFILHWQLYGTDSYDSACYVYEYDLPGMMTIQPLYGQGTRWYALLQSKSKRHRISLKYGRKCDTEGNTKMDLGIDAKFSF